MRGHIKVPQKVLELVVSGNRMTVDLTTLAGRNAARTYAWTVLAEGDKAMADSIFSIVGRTEHDYTAD